MSNPESFRQQAHLCMRLSRIAAVQQLALRLQEMAEEQRLRGDELTRKVARLVPTLTGGSTVAPERKSA